MSDIMFRGQKAVPREERENKMVLLIILSQYLHD